VLNLALAPVVSVNGILAEDKMHRFKGECAHFSFNNCPIYTHDSASAKFSTNSCETDNSVGHHGVLLLICRLLTLSYTVPEHEFVLLFLIHCKQFRMS
jgi:hypothetical protein